MKNKLLAVFLSIIFFQPLMAENLNIQSSEIFIDKKSSLTIFKGDVVATDYKNNVFKSEYAEYKKDLKFLESKGKTTILTSEGYLLTGENIIFDNKTKFIKSNNKEIIEDLIKNTVTASFSRGQDNQVSELIRICEEMKFGYVKKEKVEPMTLKAFVREQVEGGKKLPFDLFGVYIANKTKLTQKE